MKTESNLVVIGIPISKRPLNEMERTSLVQLNNILRKYPKVFIAPKDFCFNYGIEYNSYGIERFDDKYFGSTEAHNKLLLSEEFYQRFTQYKFLLLYHLDAFVFFDQLKSFCNMEYDFIGAPHYKKYVNGVCLKNSMNGGFSLRKIKSMISVLQKNKEIKKKWAYNEDLFYSWCGEVKKEILIPSTPIALDFSIETHVRKNYKKNHNQLPFGCHAWSKYDYDFYEPIIKKYGFFSQISHSNLDMIYNKKRTIEYLFMRYLRESNNIEYIEEYLSNVFDKRAQYAIWGAGQDGESFYRQLKKTKLDIICFFDNTPRKWGADLSGLLVQKPSINNIKKNNIKIFVATKIYNKEIMNQLDGFGLVKNQDYIDVSEFQNIVVEKYLSSMTCLKR